MRDWRGGNDNGEIAIMHGGIGRLGCSLCMIGVLIRW